jgi:hypothetical protein
VEHSLPGELIVSSVDDGSVPGVLLTAPSSVPGDSEQVPPGSLRATDLATGRTLWTTDVEAVGISEALVVLGRVYVVTTAGIAVLDGRSGDLLWTVAGDDHGDGNRSFSRLMTDGRYLLALQGNGMGRPGGEIAAFDLTSGSAAWSAPLPAGFDDVYASGPMLIGVAYEQTENMTKVVRVARIG